MTLLDTEEETKIEFVSESKVELIDSSCSDLDVALAAWVSSSDKLDLPIDAHTLYNLKCGWIRDSEAQKADDRIKGLINFLYRERHMSPFEHGMLKFYIDCPIGVSREFMRHRTFSYNESSTRYRDIAPRFFLVDSERPLVQSGKVGAYRFEPGTDEQYGTTFASTAMAYSQAWEAYQKMLSAGVAREVARNVLPLGTMTQFYVTGNPRNWMQFLTLRNDPNALKEIRDVAVVIEAVFAEKMPKTYAAYKKYDWRTERVELDVLRKRVAQYEAFESYESDYDTADQ